MAKVFVSCTTSSLSRARMAVVRKGMRDRDWEIRSCDCHITVTLHAKSMMAPGAPQSLILPTLVRTSPIDQLVISVETPLK